MRRRRYSGGGFSLVEVMVVLVIVGMLAGMVTLGVRGHLAQAKQDTARAELATLSEGLETYFLRYDRFPSNEEGLGALRERDASQSEPILRQDPIDPWGRPYQYNAPGRDGSAYEVFTLGADGRDGGEGADADVGTWNLRRNAGEGDAGSGES